MSGKINSSLVGGLFAGIAASACCVGPLILLFLGIGGAWVSYLTALEPYRPIFIAMALVALILAYLKIFRPKSEQLCEQGNVCAMLEISLMYKWMFVSVVMIVLLLIVSPYLIPVLLS